MRSSGHQVNGWMNKEELLNHLFKHFLLFVTLSSLRKFIFYALQEAQADKVVLEITHPILR
jgi:hypothetical protein